MLPDPPPWSAELLTVGVTGTNGKTTTTALVAAALRELGRPVARVTTVGSFLDDERVDVGEDYAGFLEVMRRCHARGGRAVALELTSEALAAGFARAWPCRVAVLTSFSHDHLDAHGSAEHYLASKAQLFVQLPPGGCAVLNAGSAHSDLVAEVVPAGVRVLRFGTPSDARAQPLDVAAEAVDVDWSGTRVRLCGRLTGLPAELQLRLLGAHFAEDALGALAAAVAAGVPAPVAAAAIAKAPPQPGRFEVVAQSPHVVIDFAHTPDALVRTLETARGLCRGRLALVIGAGGNRDPTKRVPLGAAASAADRVIVTTDNPRHEAPAAIAASVLQGLGGHADVAHVPDRREAIERAVRDAGANDVIVVAGKGHETEQLVGHERRPFSDADVARRAHAART